MQKMEKHFYLLPIKMILGCPLLSFRCFTFKITNRVCVSGQKSQRDRSLQGALDKLLWANGIWGWIWNLLRSKACGDLRPWLHWSAGWGLEELSNARFLGTWSWFEQPLIFPGLLGVEQWELRKKGQCVHPVNGWGSWGHWPWALFSKDYWKSQ